MDNVFGIEIPKGTEGKCPLSVGAIGVRFAGKKLTTNGNKIVKHLLHWVTGHVCFRRGSFHMRKGQFLTIVTDRIPTLYSHVNQEI